MTNQAETPLWKKLGFEFYSMTSVLVHSGTRRRVTVFQHTPKITASYFVEFSGIKSKKESIFTDCYFVHEINLNKA